MKRLMALLIGIMLLCAGQVVYAGSVSNDEHFFKMTWPDGFIRVPDAEVEHVALSLISADKKHAFLIMVVRNFRDGQGEEFLRSEDCMTRFYKSNKPNRILVDEMIKIGAFPARKVTYSTGNNLTIQLVQAFAGDRLYVLCNTCQNATSRVIRLFDKLVAGFSIITTAPAQAVLPATIPDAQTKPVSKSPSQNDFGSDF